MMEDADDFVIDHLRCWAYKILEEKLSAVTFETIFETIMETYDQVEGDKIPQRELKKLLRIGINQYIRLGHIVKTPSKRYSLPLEYKRKIKEDLDLTKEFQEKICDICPDDKCGREPRRMIKCGILYLKRLK